MSATRLVLMMPRQITERVIYEARTKVVQFPAKQQPQPLPTRRAA